MITKNEMIESMAKLRAENESLGIKLSKTERELSEMTRAYNTLKDKRQEQFDSDTNLEARLKDANEIIDRLHDKIIYAMIKE